MATLFSQHSSNPLEVGSSDPRNKSYNQLYNKARARRAQFSPALSSDDPLTGYTVPAQLQEYHNHIAAIVPGHPKLRADTAFVDLDEDMASDDQLLDPLRDVDSIKEEQSRNGEGLVQYQDGAQMEAEYLQDALDDDEVMEDVAFLSDDEEEEHGDDEENTLYQKKPEEREEIIEEITELYHLMPQLESDYKIVDRLGTGTFSSVYKAIDLNYHLYDNRPWHGYHPPSSSAYYQSAPHPPGSKVFVAIKRIYVTSSPERIKNELSIMIECRGCRHVSQLITAYREKDQVLIVMPYQSNFDFRDYYQQLSLQGVKAYMRCMFRALRDIHTREILHRDVKPANFLFDPTTGTGTLCDFGLACKIEPGPKLGACFHTLPTPEYPHGRTLTRPQFDTMQIKKAQREARQKSITPSEKVGYPEKDTRTVSKANRAGTRGFRAPEVLLKCGEQTGAIDVWAAGIIMLFFLTRKFPLFQSSDDIEALMEIAVIIGKKNMERVATLHSRTFATNVPSVEQDGITWQEFVERQNPQLWEAREPDPSHYPHNDPEYLARRQAELDSEPQPPPTSSSSPTSIVFPSSPTLLSPTNHHHQLPSASAEEAHRNELTSALDLLTKILNVDSTKRATPRQALQHPFLAGGDGTNPLDADEAPEDDDVYAPHSYKSGNGVCAQWHFRDEVTEEEQVRVAVRCDCGECDGKIRYEVRTLVPGQGIAIGDYPCEFHREEFGMGDVED